MRTLLAIIGLLLATLIFSQNLDVEGDAKIQTINNNSKDSVLVTDGNGVIYYRELSTIVTPGTVPGEMQYWNGTAWITPNRGSTGQVLTVIDGMPTWGVAQTAGLNEIQNPITCAIWMDRNLGASQVAVSGIDADAYGDLYQWGRGTDGHQIRTSGTTNTLSGTDDPGHGNFIRAATNPHDWRSPQNDNLWQVLSGMNNPCPSGFRLPTEAEWAAERLSWSSNDAAGVFASALKLPLAGNRYNVTGGRLNVGSGGRYWSST